MSTPEQGVVDRAFAILGAFTSTRPELSLEQICTGSGLSRSTAFRLAGQLADCGALVRTQRGWRLGSLIFELGHLVVRQERLRESALAYMQDLYAVTGATIQLAIEEGGEVLYVEIIAGHRRVPTPTRRGGRMPMHCTALGKALLAFSADGAGLPDGPLERLTSNTIVDPTLLAEELQVVRRLQVAYDMEEGANGLCCVATPILNEAGTAMAAISVSMASDGQLRPAEVAPAIQTVARALSRETWRDARSPGGRAQAGPGEIRDSTAP